MEVKDSLFDNVLGVDGTKDNLINALRDGTLSLSGQLKILSDGIRLAIHEPSLKLTGAEIKELERISGDITKAQFAIFGAYKKSTCFNESSVKPEEEIINE